MFDIAPSELLVVGLVALVVIGPKELPNVMRHLGRFVGKAKGMARHFRSGFDAMVREAELEEMEKRWREENERIMREHPMDPGPAEALETAASEPPADSSTAGLHEPDAPVEIAKPAVLPQP